MLFYILKTSLGLLSILFIIGGVFLKFKIMPEMIRYQVYTNMDLSEGTEGYNSFKEPPTKIYISYNLFNVKNPEEVKNGKKPKLQEIGPYAYWEIQRKEDLMELNARALSYSKYLEFQFDLEETERLGCKNAEGKGCSKSDKITVLNPVLITLADKLSELKLPQYIMKDINIDGDLFITEEIDKILYSGFESDTAKYVEKFILDILAKLPLTSEDYENLLKFVIPDQLKGGTFAFFKGKNASKLDSYYTIENGRFDKDKFMNIIEFNGRKELPDNWWPDVAPTVSGQYSGTGGSCHRIYGTDGTQFPPYLFDKKDFSLWLFVGELCRSINVEYHSEVEVKNGIMAYRYSVGEEVFSFKNPNNFCYCKDFFSCASADVKNDSWDVSKCHKCLDGVLDVSGCYGAPIFMSQPHFLQGDPVLLEGIEGLSPSSDIHSTYVDVEPNLGTPLRAHKKIQINLALKKNENFPVLQNVQEFLIFPTFWADEGAELDEENAVKLQSQLFTPINIGNIVGIAFGLVLGPISFIAFLALSFWEKKKQTSQAKKEEKLEKAESST